MNDKDGYEVCILVEVGRSVAIPDRRVPIALDARYEHRDPPWANHIV